MQADPRRLRNAVVSISLGREDLATLLPRVTVPTLMITGEEHSGWTPAQAGAAVTALPHGRVAVVPDAAYLVPLEQPVATVALVRGFWASARARHRKVGSEHPADGRLGRQVPIVRAQ